MLLEPRAPADGPQFRKRGRKAAAAHDAVGVLNLHHAMWLLLVAAVAQILDDVGSCSGNSDENFARHFSVRCGAHITIAENGLE